MTKLKNFLCASLGGAGFIVYYVLCICVTVFPLLMFDMSWWLYIILSLVVTLVVINIPFGIEILYIVGLFGAISGPQNFFAILYYILFALIVGSTLIRLIIAIIMTIIESRSRRY